MKVKKRQSLMSSVIGEMETYTTDYRGERFLQCRWFQYAHRELGIEIVRFENLAAARIALLDYIMDDFMPYEPLGIPLLTVLERWDADYDEIRHRRAGGKERSLWVSKFQVVRCLWTVLSGHEDWDCGELRMFRRSLEQYLCLQNELYPYIDEKFLSMLFSILCCCDIIRLENDIQGSRFDKLLRGLGLHGFISRKKA